MNALAAFVPGLKSHFVQYLLMVALKIWSHNDPKKNY